MSEEAKAAIEKVCRIVDENPNIRLGVELACDIVAADRERREAEEKKEQ